MTYMSPSPEDAFEELANAASVDSLEASVDDAEFCSRLQSNDFHFFNYNLWQTDDERASERAPELYGVALMHRLDAHVHSCWSCQQRYRDYAMEIDDERAEAQRIELPPAADRRIQENLEQFLEDFSKG